MPDNLKTQNMCDDAVGGGGGGGGPHILCSSFLIGLLPKRKKK